MITFIAEAKPKTPNPQNRTGLQHSLGVGMGVGDTVNESMATHVSHIPQVSAGDTANISQVGMFFNTEELERRMCLERLPFSLDVSLFINDAKIGSGTIRNVGGRGMFIETASELNKGAPLQLGFTLMGNSRLPSHRVVGRVAHVTNQGVGVHLDVLKRDTLAGLQALKKQAARAHRSKISS